MSIRFLGLLLLSFVPVGVVQATEPEAPEPLVIEANRVEIDDRTGVSTYTGNVQVTRGGMRLNCDILTIQHSDGKVEQGECEGQPATFRRAAEGEKKEVRGHAQRVEYYTDEERVILLNDAHLEQERDTFDSQRIVYFLQRDVVHAGTEAQDSDRVRITIHPDEKEQQSGDESGNQ